MQALTFWKTIAVDKSNLIEQLIALFKEHSIQYCIIGGQAVNAYAEPVVSLDLDLVVASNQLSLVETLLAQSFRVERLAHSVNVSFAGSDVRVQIQTDPRYADFVKRASSRTILGIEMPVAQVEDVLRGKVWAAQDVTRRGSKRQKDLADIARLLENYPHLRSQVPADILARLV